MAKDVVLAEDDEDFLFIVSSLAENLGCAVYAFNKPSLAYRHLQGRTEPPALCLVDMKPYGYIPEKYDPHLYPEADVPERIGQYIKERNWQNSFYFMTGGVSEHDRTVLDRTGLPCILKDKITGLLEKLT